MSTSNKTDTTILATRIRAHALKMINRAGSAHIGSSLSMADLLSVLYSSVLRIDPDNPQWPERDRLIVSKGHAAAGVHAVLAEKGFSSGRGMIWEKCGCSWWMTK